MLRSSAKLDFEREVYVYPDKDFASRARIFRYKRESCYRAQKSLMKPLRRILFSVLQRHFSLYFHAS